jgi:hypothetical protein
VIMFMEELIMTDKVLFWAIRGGEELALESLVTTAWKLRQAKNRKCT